MSEKIGCGRMFLILAVLVVVVCFLAWRNNSNLQAQDDAMFAAAIAEKGAAIPTQEDESIAAEWLAAIKAKDLRGDPSLADQRRARIKITFLIKAHPKTKAAREAHAILVNLAR